MITPVLIIHSHLEPMNENDDSSEYSLDLFVKNFKAGKPIAGQSYSFSHSSTLDNYIPLDSIFKCMWKEGMNVALIGSGDMPNKSASGIIRFSYDENEEGMNGDFEATIMLIIGGSEPIQFECYMYTAIM